MVDGEFSKWVDRYGGFVLRSLYFYVLFYFKGKRIIFLFFFCSSFFMEEEFYGGLVMEVLLVFGFKD